MVEKTDFYNIKSEYSIDPATQTVGTPSAVLASAILDTNNVELDQMLLVPVKNGKGFFGLKDYLSPDDLYVAVKTSTQSVAPPRIVWRQTSKTLRLVASYFSIFVGGPVLNTVRLGMTLYNAGSNKERVAMLASPAYLLGKSTYDIYSSIFNNYSRIVRPEDLRNDIDLDKQKDPKNAAKEYPEDPTFYPIKFYPSSQPKNYLNKSNGAVIVSTTTSDDPLQNIVNQKTAVGGPSSYNVVRMFTVDFYQQVPIDTTIKLVQMLDVQLPANPKDENAFQKTRASAQELAMEHVLNPLDKLLSNMVQVKALAAAKKRSGPGSGFNSKNIDANKNPIYRSATIADDIALAKTALEGTNVAVVVPGGRSEDDMTALRHDRAMMEAEQSMMKSIVKDLERDVNNVWVSGGVQANINAGTTFGNFCKDYLNVLNTLEKSWVTGKNKTTKKGVSNLKKKAATTKPVVTTTPNLAQLEEQRQAILSENRILRVPGKNDAVFTDHADWNNALSLLDELRDEQQSAVMTKNIVTKTVESSAPLVNSSESDFEKELATFTQPQRDLLESQLKERFNQNNKKIIELLQKVKRLQFSPQFLLAQAVTGVPGIFPIKFLNGQIDIPSISIDAFQSAIDSSISGAISAGLSQAGNLNTALIKNTIDSAADAVAGAGSGVGLIGSSLKSFGAPVNLSFISSKSSSSNSVVSSKLADIKKIVEKPVETTGVVKGVRQSSTETLKRYGDLLDEINTLKNENETITANIATIKKVSAVGATKSYQEQAEAARKKADSTVAKIESGKKTAYESSLASSILADLNKSSAAVTVVDAASSAIGPVIKNPSNLNVEIK
jgi:hypothetical protein